MKYQVNFEYKQIGDDGKFLRSRGTQAKLTVDHENGFVYARSVGDDLQGRGESIKEAILDWLSQCGLV